MLVGKPGAGLALLGSQWAPLYGTLLVMYLSIAGKVGLGSIVQYCRYVVSNYSLGLTLVWAQRSAMHGGPADFSYVPVRGAEMRGSCQLDERD